MAASSCAPRLYRSAWAGMMVTALMLGLVSGASPICISPIACAQRRRSLGYSWSKLPCLLSR